MDVLKRLFSDKNNIKLRKKIIIIIILLFWYDPLYMQWVRKILNILLLSLNIVSGQY